MQEVEEVEKWKRGHHYDKDNTIQCFGNWRHGKLVGHNNGNNNIKVNLSAEELDDESDVAQVAVVHGSHDRLIAETSKNFQLLHRK